MKSTVGGGRGKHGWARGGSGTQEGVWKVKEMQAADSNSSRKQTPEEAGLDADKGAEPTETASGLLKQSNL